MTEQHPLTPPPELVQKWNNLPLSTEEIITIAWRHGADQELEACCEVLHQHDRAYLLPSQLRAARRPKPPSLAEEALEAARLELLPGHKSHALILKALERLQELEGGNA